MYPIRYIPWGGRAPPKAKFQKKACFRIWWWTSRTRKKRKDNLISYPFKTMATELSRQWQRNPGNNNQRNQEPGKPTSPNQHSHLSSAGLIQTTRQRCCLSVLENMYDLTYKSPEQRLNLSRSRHKGLSRAYNTSFFIKVVYNGFVSPDIWTCDSASPAALFTGQAVPLQYYDLGLQAAYSYPWKPQESSYRRLSAGILT